MWTISGEVLLVSCQFASTGTAPCWHSMAARRLLWQSLQLIRILESSSSSGTASVVLWSEFLATDPEVPGFDSRRFQISEKQRVWNGVHPASWGQLRSYLEEKVAAPVKKTEINDRPWESVSLTTQHPLSAKVGTTSPTSVGRSVGIVRSRTKATELSLVSALLLPRRIRLSGLCSFRIN
jgi:hypothetical protein